MAETMTVVIDVDETAAAWPRFFGWLASALRRDGHKLVVLTARRDRDGTAALLERLGVEFDVLETPPDSALDAFAWKLARAAALAPDVLVDDAVELVNGAGPRTCALVPRDASLGRLDYVP